MEGDTEVNCSRGAFTKLWLSSLSIKSVIQESKVVISFEIQQMITITL